MKTYFCNYSDLNYRHNQTKLCEHIKANDIFDEVVPYTREWLVEQEFYKKNKHILDKERLAGYAIWKPFIIIDLMSKINEGDVVVYMDCGDIPVHKDINEHVKNYMKNHDQYFITAMVHDYDNHKYTKRDCFILMGCDEELYWKSIQLEDGFIAFKKTEQNLKLLKEWLEFCEDERIVTDMPNTQQKPNSNFFVDHRHDQSILSLLQVKYNLPTSNDVRQFIKFNTLYHINGESFSNGTAKWSDGFKIS